MKSLEEALAHLREVAERCAARAEEPDMLAQQARWEAEAEEDVRQQRRAARYFSGIPRTLWPLMEEPGETPAMAKARTFMAGEKSVLLLSGTVGQGKTVAAAWCVDQLGGRFIEATDVAQMSTYDVDGFRGLQQPRVLAIDELGTEPLDPKGWCEAKLYDVINGRLQAGKHTVLCTNLSPKAFIARYPDARLRDRLRAHADFLELQGPSMRGTA